VYRIQYFLELHKIAGNFSLKVACDWLIFILGLGEALVSKLSQQ
jgi:hypothetical protein